VKIPILSNIYIIFICKAHQHKAACMQIRLSKNNDLDGVSHVLFLLYFMLFYSVQRRCPALQAALYKCHLVIVTDWN